MKKEFVEKGGKVEDEFLEFAFYFIWSTQGKYIVARNHFSTLTWTCFKGFEWLFQMVVKMPKKKNIC